MFYFSRVRVFQGLRKCSQDKLEARFWDGYIPVESVLGHVRGLKTFQSSKRTEFLEGREMVFNLRILLKE